MAKASDFFKNIFFFLLLLQFAPMLFENIKKQYSRYFEPHTKIGYLPVKGIIVQSSSYIHNLKKLFENREVKAILMVIESPGGAAGSAEAIAHEISILKKEHPKPIITLTENILASGGYYIAAATDYIIASPSSLIGSIGATIPGQFKVHDFIEEYKIHYNVIKAGEYKAITDPFAPTSPEHIEWLTTIAKSSYANFIEHVSSHRPKLAIQNASTWADGKIFTGKQALSLGLIDLLGSQSNALEKIKEMTIVEGALEWVKPMKASSFWDLIFGSSEAPDDTTSLLATSVNAICTALESRYASHRIVH